MDFQDYQRAFTAHIRDPKAAKRPPGAQARRMRVYNELLFNNVQGFLLACFPVCREILGKRRWDRMARAFFRDHVSKTPFFRQIPEEFLRFLQDEYTLPEDFPAFLPELAHYEWVELALESSDRDGETPVHDPDGDLLAGCPLLNPVLMLLAYRYPVHRLSRRHRPVRAPDQPTYLLAYRHAASLEVRFQEISVLTARLLDLHFREPQLHGAQALARLAGEAGAADETAFLAAGRDLLRDLQRAGVILGSRIPA